MESTRLSERLHEHLAAFTTLSREVQAPLGFKALWMS